MTDDADRIRAEVERREHRAWQRGLPDLTTRFYRDLARFYPAWRGNHPAIVPQLISDIREVGRDAVEFSYQDHRYSLTWEERSTTLPDGDLHLSCTLSLLVDGSRVLEIYLHGDFNEYSGTKWRPTDVRAFIEGPWIPPFKEVAAEGERLQAVYRHRAEEDERRRETEDLMSRFGMAADTHHQASPSHRGSSADSLAHGRQGSESRLSLQARLGTLLRRLFGLRGDE